jgi:hypothetical protein
VETLKGRTLCFSGGSDGWLSSQHSKSMLERIDLADVEALDHIGASTDGDSAIRVDLDNIVGTGGALTQSLQCTRPFWTPRE